MKYLRLSKFAILVLVVVCFGVDSARADRRNFVWTYQYQTMPEGGTELEFYQTLKLNQTPDKLDRWELQLEVEHGLSTRWDFSVYQIFSQAEGGQLGWDAVQFRTRYRIGEEGQYPLDPLLYFEYQRPLETERPNQYELKLILAKTVAPWLISLNPVYELKSGPGSEHEIGLDMGGACEFSPRISAGLESSTRIEFENGERETQSFFGPTISLASGAWWYSIGAGMRVSEEHPGLESTRLRLLMGLGL